MPSLIAGLGLGGVFVGAGVITPSEPFKGHLLALTASLTTVAAMGKRYMSTKKIMPAGVVLGLGVVGALYNGIKTKREYELL